MMCNFWLRGQNLNLRPSGYEPNIFGGFLPTNRGGGQMVDRPDEPNTVVETWWTDNVHLLGKRPQSSKTSSQNRKPPIV